ncbi:hypothetical protein OJ962_02915 [Solirubrobacter sp. CPCC 204708]|uniref:Uncharacterized protein n=1 Tax=Solirubrobacter deserti TaxID=2282478 RepID=A0ABT4RD38_9ACTN|nr:hypothetical protein [Solirubrobacter deserti]MDA0136432.1 hypothetical protein [Solirubrobacter deserti]
MHDGGDRGRRVLLHEPQVELDDLRVHERHQRERAGVGADVIECDHHAARAHGLDAGQHLGGLVGQGALGQLDHDLELARRAREQGHELLGHRDVEQRRLDVDEQRLAQPGVQGAAQRGGAARPLELFDQPARAGGLEQQVGAFERRPDRASRQRFIADDLTRVEVDDRLVDGADEAGLEDRAELSGAGGLLEQDRGH